MVHTLSPPVVTHCQLGVPSALSHPPTGIPTYGYTTAVPHSYHRRSAPLVGQVREAIFDRCLAHVKVGLDLPQLGSNHTPYIRQSEKSVRMQWRVRVAQCEPWLATSRALSRSCEIRSGVRASVRRPCVCCGFSDHRVVMHLTRPPLKGVERRADG
jgi:hypothetical protein